MTRCRSRSVLALLAFGLALGTGPCHADGPAAKDFTWRAPLELPAGASLVRLSLPPQAMLQLQSRDARDLRVFNGAGEPVAFAFMGASAPAVAPPPAKTRSYPALPLYSATAGAARPRGSLQVRIEEPGRQGSVWVQMNGGPPSSGNAPKLNSVLFATQGEQQTITGLEVQATLPANTPVWLSASSSADLAQWTPAPVHGRLYRFEGEGAPVNMTLEFDRPLQLEGKYLRLDWDGQQGVSLAAVTGVITAPAPAAQRVHADLAAPESAGASAVELATGFLTPIAALSLSTLQDNALLPVRILGRNEAAQPWALLGQTVVFRLSNAGAPVTSNPPVDLHGASARWLRVESFNGSNLAAAKLSASAEFEPLQLVFVASGAGPFELALGRAGTPAVALPLATIASTLGKAKIEELPAAHIGAAVARHGGAGPLARVWRDYVQSKRVVLWAVLVAGVALLGGVAWSLLRQLKA